MPCTEFLGVVVRLAVGYPCSILLEVLGCKQGFLCMHGGNPALQCSCAVKFASSPSTSLGTAHLGVAFKAEYA